MAGSPLDTRGGGAPIVQAAGLGRTYGTGTAAVRALENVNLAVYPGQLVALMGRSGSGKTTLLNLLAGLDRPTTGEVFFAGQPLSALPDAAVTRLRRRRIGLVFQFFGLLPLLSARENVEMPLRMLGLPARERRQRATEWLRWVGLDKRLDHRPWELSGGEQQRVALARALAVHPDLVLADEPTGQLDTRSAAQVMDLLRRVTRETGVAVCFTTHDPDAAAVADVVYTLMDGRLMTEA